MHRLSELRAKGIPVFRFGSEQLDKLHAEAKDPPFFAGMRAEGWQFYNDRWNARRSYAYQTQVYGWSYHGYQYVVDHGGFYTLQTIYQGQVVPASEDVIA